MNSTALPTTVWERVVAALSTEQFRAEALHVDRRSLITLANSLGGPPMRLLHWKRLADLRRIPHSDEKEAVDALAGIDSFGAPLVEVFMVSHRWLRPCLDRHQSHPDGPGNEKARAIDHFSRWRREWVRHRHGFMPELFYWIDYCCFDQARAADAVPLLPLWVACCERFLRVETADYDDRTWCRLEPLLSYMFSFADHHVAIGLDFEFRWPHYGTESLRPVLDPRRGKNTDPEDTRRILPLVELATQLRPAHTSRSLVDWNKTAVKCYSL
jgi:hypothetical protein